MSASVFTSLANLFPTSISQHARLITLTTAQGSALPESLAVERFSAEESVNGLFTFEIDALSVSTDLDLSQFIGEEISLQLLQADGSRRAWHGYCTHAAWMGADGGVARYHLRLEPFLALLALRRNSQVFQDKTVLDIITDILADYPQANFRFDVAQTLPTRPICTQYRETDLAFITRLLASEGLSWYFTHEQPTGATSPQTSSTDTPHAKHQWVIIDSQSALPTQGGGYDVVRFHRNAASEASDAIDTFGAQRSVQSNAVAHTSWHPVQLQGPAHEVGSSLDAGNLPVLQVFDGSGERRFDTPALAEAHSQRVLGALELGNKAFTGRGAVRHMAAGHRFALTQHEHYPEGSNAFTVLSVRHAAVNNLDTNVAASPLQSQPDGAGTTHTALLATLERGTYRNAFTCVRQAVPLLPSALAQRSAPTVLGAQTALVVGLPEATLTTDRDHRVQVQFAWQRHASTNAQQATNQGVWVRVAEAQAGPNWGTQFTPRIGGEVLVDFIEGDIDRPVVVAQLYNGADQPPFAAGVDAGTNHAGTISGWHSQEVAAGDSDSAGGGESGGGSGYNQWVLDDSTGQLRMRLASSGATSQLNLGHLVSQSPSSAQRGNYRGAGFELRSDAWGSVRGAHGVLLSTSARTQAGTSVQSTQMDMAEAVAQLQSAKALTQALSDAASRQQALHSVDAAKAHTTSITHTDVAQDGKHAATVNGQEARKAQAGGRTADSTPQGAVERFKTPWVVMECPSNLHWASPASTLVFASEQLHSSTQGDSHWAAGHTWSSVSANANTLFSHSGGIKAFAGNGPVSVQAHTSALELLADKDITIVSVNDEITINANSKITLQAGQSAIVLEGGNITFTCPGTFTAKGSSHPFGAGASVAAGLPVLPNQLISPAKEDIQLEHTYHDSEGLRGAKYTAKLSNGETRTGVLDGAGKATISGVPAGTNAEVTYSPAEFAFMPKGATHNPTHAAQTSAGQLSALVDKYAADLLTDNKE